MRNDLRPPPLRTGTPLNACLNTWGARPRTSFSSRLAPVTIAFMVASTWSTTTGFTRCLSRFIRPNRDRAGCGAALASDAVGFVVTTSDSPKIDGVGETLPRLGYVSDFKVGPFYVWKHFRIMGPRDPDRNTLRGAERAGRRVGYADRREPLCPGTVGRSSPYNNGSASGSARMALVPAEAADLEYW